MHSRPGRVLLLAVWLLGCSDGPSENPDLSVASPDRELLGATVMLDGEEVGTLQHLSFARSWLGQLIKPFFSDLEAYDVVNLDLSFDSEMAEGLHEVSLRRLDRCSRVRRFSVPVEAWTGTEVVIFRKSDLRECENESMDAA